MVYKQAWSIKNYRYVGDVSVTDLAKKTVETRAWELAAR
jgi:hypothetical protein